MQTKKFLTISTLKLSIKTEMAKFLVLLPQSKTGESFANYTQKHKLKAGASEYIQLNIQPC